MAAAQIQQQLLLAVRMRIVARADLPEDYSASVQEYTRTTPPTPVTIQDQPALLARMQHLLKSGRLAWQVNCALTEAVMAMPQARLLSHSQ